LFLWLIILNIFNITIKIIIMIIIISYEKNNFAKERNKIICQY